MMPFASFDWVLLHQAAERRRRAADAALTEWLNQSQGQRDPWLLVHARRDLVIAERLEQLIRCLNAEKIEARAREYVALIGETSDG